MNSLQASDPVDARESTASVGSILRVVARRAWIVVLCVGLAVGGAFALSSRQTAEYQAAAQVYLDPQDLASALTGIDNTPQATDAQRYADTQASIARTPAVAQRALRIAGVRGSTGNLLRHSTVTALTDTDILVFTVTQHEPRLARRLADAFARAFVAYTDEFDTNSAQSALVAIQAKLSELKAAGSAGSPLYQSLQTKAEELSGLQTLESSRVHIVSNDGSTTQVAPRPKRDAAFGAVLGMILGLALAFAIDAADRRARTSDEISTLLQMPLLARIPEFERRIRRSRQLAMVADASGASAEGYRMLRTGLELARLDNPDLRAVVITSAAQGEGKSTTAANLAVAFAGAGRRIALVDLDLRRPTIESFFGLVGRPGLTNVVVDQLPLGSALVRIEAARGLRETPAHQASENGSTGCLDVLTCGPLPPDPGEFIAERVRPVLDELRRTHDFIIIDTPPLLNFGDAMTVALESDGTVLVTQLGASRRPALLEARRILGSVPVRKLGVVVTRVAPGEAMRGYGSYGPQPGPRWEPSKTGTIGSG